MKTNDTRIEEVNLDTESYLAYLRGWKRHTALRNGKNKDYKALNDINPTNSEPLGPVIRRRAMSEARLKKVRRICPICGKEFLPHHNRQKYCGGECVKKVDAGYRQKYRERKQAESASGPQKTEN